MVTKSRQTPAGDDSTIAAIITPPGEGGIAAVRLAGPASHAILDSRFRASTDSDAEPFVLRHGHFLDADGVVVDEVMAVFMPKGHSYTGLDQAEIFCHGGRQVVRLILGELLDAGARAAEPGEFTKLAFLNGRIDLTRAEAVAAIVAANTESSYKASREHLLGAYSKELEDLRSRMVSTLADLEAAVDFVDQEIETSENAKLATAIRGIVGRLDLLLKSYQAGRMIKEGYRIAIAGRPNAGKSSLFNRMLRQERALVHETAGTTRDYLSEWIDLDGFAVNLIDTAGLRHEGGQVEKAGQARAQEIVENADLVLWIFDLSEPGWERTFQEDLDHLPEKGILLLGNKIDLLDKPPPRVMIEDYSVTEMSCMTCEGLDIVREKILARINERIPDLTSGVVVTSARHQQKLAIAREAAERAAELAGQNESPEVLAFELRQAVEAIDEITGRIYTEEILGEIFGKFCIGK